MPTTPEEAAAESIALIGNSMNDAAGSLGRGELGPASSALYDASHELYHLQTLIHKALEEDGSDN